MPGPEKASLTIKSVPTETRRKMLACASRRGMTMAELLAHMVDAQVEQVAKDLVLPPSAPDDAVPESRPAGLVDVGRLRDAFLALGAVAQSSGVPVPKAAARHAYALLTDQLREERGLPRLAPRQTRRPNGQTINGHGVANQGAAGLARAADTR